MNRAYILVIPSAIVLACGEPDAGNLFGSGGQLVFHNDAGGSGGFLTVSSSGPVSSSAASGGSDAGPSDGASGCAHTPCAAGAPLDQNCDPLVYQMCTATGPANAKCCTEHWTELCASQWYHNTGSAGFGCGVHDNTCAHDPCVVGAPLDGTFYSSCGQLVADLCADPMFSYCCSAVWDLGCVNQMQGNCTWSSTECSCQ